MLFKLTGKTSSNAIVKGQEVELENLRFSLVINPDTGETGEIMLNLSSPTADLFKLNKRYTLAEIASLLPGAPAK